MQSSAPGQPRARRLRGANDRALRRCGVDPASLPILTPKLEHVNLLLEGVRLYAANILKQTMLSLGGDVAVHRGVIAGKVPTSACLLMGDKRHYRSLVERLQDQPGMAPLAALIREQVFTQPARLTLQLCGRERSWDDLPVIMGILNVTPDSFSDGGNFVNPARACEHARAMVAAGAGLIDIGGESTRPGAAAASPAEEIRRVVPVIRQLAHDIPVPISIDTRNAAVARAAIEAGAGMINDISALTHDPGMMAVARDSDAAVVLMHMRGRPETMQTDTHYDDIVQEIYAYLDERVRACRAAGIESIVVDPGIGFGKDPHGNLTLVHHIAEFASLGTPVLLGHSRKSFIGALLDKKTDQRGPGTDAVSAWAVIQGVHILRVHDVGSTQQIKSVCRAIMEHA